MAFLSEKRLGSSTTLLPTRVPLECSKLIHEALVGLTFGFVILASVIAVITVGALSRWTELSRDVPPPPFRVRGFVIVFPEERMNMFQQPVVKRRHRGETLRTPNEAPQEMLQLKTRGRVIDMTRRRALISLVAVTRSTAVGIAASPLTRSSARRVHQEVADSGNHVQVERKIVSFGVDSTGRSGTEAVLGPASASEGKVDSNRNALRNQQRSFELLDGATIGPAVNGERPSTLLPELIKRRDGNSSLISSGNISQLVREFRDRRVVSTEFAPSQSGVVTDTNSTGTSKVAKVTLIKIHYNVNQTAAVGESERSPKELSVTT